MARQASLAPITGPNSTAPGVRSPKTAELVARTLRKMIVDGQLKDGDFLPNETELMAHFSVSRPTLREAVRVLESERLVEVRRGSRTGARVRVPGAEIVARPASLLLELSGATLADVMAARSVIEPPAAKLVAEQASKDAHAELMQIVAEVPQAWADGNLAHASAVLHRRLVELSGNATLAMIAGMLQEISERHTTSAIDTKPVPKALYQKLLKSYNRLVELLEARSGDAAQAHWRRHMETSGALLLEGYEQTRVRDIMH